MLLAMVAFFLQIERGGMYSEIISGNKALYIRGLDRLSWREARATCDNMSNTILPGIRVKHALSSLDVGEVAWIDGKEYTICFEKNTTDVKKTKKECRYVTVRREDKTENLAYVCGNAETFHASDKLLPYAEAVKLCSESKVSLLTVKNFVLPMLLPVNKTYWIGEYHAVRIVNRLSPVEKVTEICIGIVKLDHDKFEFGTTSCDENHTVICDATGVDTAKTVAIRHEKMPSLDNLKARIAFYQQKDDGQKNDSSKRSLTWSVLYTACTILVRFLVHQGI